VAFKPFSVRLKLSELTETCLFPLP